MQDTYTSAYPSDQPSGVRTVLHLAGALGLASVGGTARTRSERSAFRMTFAVSRFGALDVAHVSHTAMIVPAEASNFGRPHRAARMAIVLSGEVDVSVEGRSSRIGPGGGALLPGWENYLYESTSDVSLVYVDMPADEPPFAAALQNLRATLWPTGVPILHVAGVNFVEVVRRDEPDSDDTSRNALAQMVESVVLSVLASPHSGGLTASARQRQRARVLAHIAAHHTTPTLSSTTIAADLGISKRSLQRLFENEAMGIVDHIAAARLDHALALLRDPLLAEASMELIATRAGFSSVPRMRRQVQAVTGTSLKAYRDARAGGVPRRQE